jgi:hypothetical protein
MDSSVLLLVMAICAFVLIGLGGIALLKVPTKQGQTKTTDQILRKVCFEDDNSVIRKELSDYFTKVVGNLTKASFCLSIAFMILSMTVKGLNPDISFFQAMGRILPFALIPILIIMVAKNKVMNLWSDCLDKLKKS